MNLILFDDPAIRANLLPLTFTRPVAEIRIGILKISEKWEKLFQTKPSFSTTSYLSKKYTKEASSDNLWINGGVCPDPALVDAIKKLKLGEGIYKNSMIIGVRTDDHDLPEVIPGKVAEYPNDLTIIDQPWKIFQNNGNQIRADFKLITTGRKSAAIKDPHTHTYNASEIFIEEGAVLHTAVLNAEGGPIYLGKNSQVQEGAILRGPFSLGEGAIVNMGGKMRADTTIGPFCKIGGEVSNAILFAHSNKSHDGFLGNSIIGEWCNLGADTNTSNLKNNYDSVRLWSYARKSFVNTGLPFCGLIMGDHSKSGINTMFNTGTVVGVSSNIFGAGYPRNFIPSFQWGGAAGFVTYQYEKAMETAHRVMARRNIKLDETEREILKCVFDETNK
ncbi:MAG TPA: GlmU family protein [Cyclobacteriaceae bacterium]|jgi:UDP-N-acetylglucosamine diphosphorylase/glucosamine-1-phosphate N-acetyltransferase|nr:GlmU family protein [Cyclobacteriaceae bacterium]